MMRGLHIIAETINAKATRINIMHKKMCKNNYLSCMYVSNCLPAKYEDNRFWRHIDKAGKYVINPQFDNIVKFVNSLYDNIYNLVLQLTDNLLEFLYTQI